MNQGFSLVEVIVALLIFSIGVLGIAKMNALAIQGMDQSYLKNRVAIQVCEKNFQGVGFSKWSQESESIITLRKMDFHS